MVEIWKDIAGYEGLYQVSDKGRIYSCIRNTIIKAGNNRGYMLVALTKDKHAKSFPVHRLVAEAFIENPQNKPQVNHIDGNKQNNCVENLEWCTAKENINHAWDNGLFINKEKYNENTVVGKLRQQTGLSQTAFAKYFEIPLRTVQDWEQGKRKPPEYLVKLMQYKLEKENIIK